MFIEKLNVKIFDDYKIKGKKPKSDLIGEFTTDESMGADSDNLEPFIEGIISLYEYDPVRVVVSYETTNS
tara:strand:- start:10179 stop:10388 length:210 start_codon:yes stop_codon:yes gene_type:complete